MPRKPNYDRNDLVKRARDLFWKQGWSGTSLKDLEAVLKMKPGSFYAAFGSKEALFELAMVKYTEDGIERLQKLSEEHGAAKTLQMFPAMVIGNEDAPAKACMLAKTFLELNAHGHPLAKKANLHLSQMEAIFAELFEEAQSDGTIGKTQDPAILARRYQSDLMGLRVSAERDGINASEIAEEIAENLARI